MSTACAIGPAKSGGSVRLLSLAKPAEDSKPPDELNPPEESAHWRLFVKRGRDGKDGEKGEKGDTGKAGRNGRDLTQLGHDGSKW